MHGAKYYLETFGCQMNVLDSQLVEGQLRELGLRAVRTHREADIILFNTCSVRQHAEDKVLSRLGQLRGFKQRRPETIIGVIGCMAERVGAGLLAKEPHVDLLCGPGELNRLPALLQEVWGRRKQVMARAGSLSRRTEVLQRALEYDSLEALDLSRSPGPDDNILQSYIRVQRGCDKFCTYCVVPFTRGPERSRPPGHIVEEAKMLADRGCREVTLLGQTVNSYVHTEDGTPVRFAQLLERVHAVTGLDRIRFVTSFPADWDDDIFRVIRDYPRICSYLHIPAQSGSDRILKAMRRGYTVAEYLKLMDTARRYVPDISLAGDFIVGFCGETEEDFAATVDLVQRVQYKSLFVFKYSPRPGTVAERHRAADVPPEVKARRNNELLAIQSGLSLKRKQALIGRTVEVLVEGYSKIARKAQNMGGRGPACQTVAPVFNRCPSLFQESQHPRGRERVGCVSTHLLPAPITAVRPDAPYSGSDPTLPRPLPGREGRPVRSFETRQLVGRTPGDLIVVFDGDESHIGAIVTVRIDDVSPLTLFGRLESVVSPARSPTLSARTPLPVLSAPDTITAA